MTTFDSCGPSPTAHDGPPDAGARASANGSGMTASAIGTAAMSLLKSILSPPNGCTPLASKVPAKVIDCASGGVSGVAAGVDGSGRERFVRRPDGADVAPAPRVVFVLLTDPS